MSNTGYGIGPGSWNNSALASEQERKAKHQHVANNAVVFTLYTEAKANIAELVTRYFSGATITFGWGIWQGGSEPSATITIIARHADLQRVFDLAGDIRVTNNQSSVIVTWQNVSRFDITEDAINDSQAAL